MLTLGKEASPPAYRPPLTVHREPMLDKVLAVWYGACDRSGPPSWEDMGDLVWQPWFVHLVVVESRHRMKPARCVAVLLVATALLGLPLYGFGGVLPMDNPRTAELSSLTRLASMRLRVVFWKLPENTTPTGVGGRPLVIGMPLASACRVERVLFAVVNQGAGGSDGIVDT